MDISKAYDRVEWRYLEEVMRKLGFSPVWVQWMMLCVRSVEYAVIMNNQRYGRICPSRGLRQGCPLSPFLFILCTEGLTAMLRQESMQELGEARKLREIFDLYSATSGQLINYEKSGIFFSKNLDDMLAEGLSHVLQIFNPFDTQRYLGVPILIGRNRTEAFKSIHDRIWNKLQAWQGKKISKRVRRF
ncbi:Uncharacterized mitochondrial protein AtMg01250 [Linum grandiflorum]